MKTTASFNLSKPTKCAMALGKFKDMDQRHAFRRAMVQAELAASIKPKNSHERQVAMLASKTTTK